MAGTFNSLAMVSGLGLRVLPKRFITIINGDKYNGDALLHLLTKLRAPARNRVVLSNRQLGKLGAGTQIVFRSSQLLP